MMWCKKKSAFILGLSLLIAVFVWSQIGMYLAHLLFGVNIRVNFFKFCISLFKESSFYYFLVIILLNAFIAYTILVTIIKITKQYVLSKKFKQKLFQLKNIELTNILNDEFNRQSQDIMVIDHNQSLAFTIGCVKPYIVLSSALLEMLEDHELEAVIEHETFHQRNRDPLKVFILQLISQSLWFIPVTKWAYQNYKIMSEVLADEYAIQRTGSELGLGSALLKLVKNNFHTSIGPVVVHFSDESVNYRLQQLVNPQKAIPVKLTTTSIVISIHVLFLFMSMVLVTIA